MVAQNKIKSELYITYIDQIHLLTIHTMSARKAVPSQTKSIPANSSPTSSDSVLSTYTTFKPCPHLSKVLSSNAKDMVLKTYSTGMKICLMNTINKNGKKFIYLTKDNKKIDQKSLLKLKSKILSCKDCSEISLIFMCLQCPNVGCFEHNHAFNHARNNGHIFGINPTNGFMMCFKCREYVSDPILEKIRINQIENSNMLSLFPGLPIYSHEHDSIKNELILKDSRIPTFKATTGLKGFINMGSTCFMSSILQTFIHNPFIRNYFLSGYHMDCNKKPEDCLFCCVDEIFKNFYTSSTFNGFGPTSLLTASWKVKRSLAGYSEQDAHEFWQFLVHQLHKNDTKRIRNNNNSKEQTPSLDTNNNTSFTSTSSSHCNCLTHDTFAGELQSSIKCKDCNKLTITVDPMLDISLEISEKNSSSSVSSSNKNSKSLESLINCLDKFTKSEKLDVKYSCSNCNKKTEATKKLLIKKLPKTLTIQLKRFEHLGISSKIDYPIEIPLILEMSKYSLDKSELKPYELFAVVCHIGSVNTGHYISMIKNKDGMWFKFDDATVTRVTERDVLNSKAYLLFYIIHELP